MNEMSYTFEQFEKDKETLLNLIADCEELEKMEFADEYFIQCDEFNQNDYTVWHEFSYFHCQCPATSWRPSQNLAGARFSIY